MMLLDTHALIWLDEGNQMLGNNSLSAIDESLKSGELFVSTISFWKVAMLVEKGRLDMRIEVGLWRQHLLDNGLQEAALSGDIAIPSASIKKFHGDPADCMIIATAINLTATLCTADK